MPGRGRLNLSDLPPLPSASRSARRSRLLRPLLILLSVPLFLYLLALVALVVFQRGMMYFPVGPAGSAADWGLPRAETLRLKAADGETIVAWHQPARPGKPLFLYFHGNGGTLPLRLDLLRQLSADGSGFLAIDYDGYGGSTGRPSETGLLADGHAAFAETLKLGYPRERIVVLGESLGTGVAVAVAADEPVRALVLDSAFSSTADVAAARYWMFPVRLAMRDRFDSASRIGRVGAPKLFLHGSADTIVPIAFDRKLYAAARQPKTFVEISGAGHLVLWKPDVMARMKAWLADLGPDAKGTAAP